MYRLCPLREPSISYKSSSNKHIQCSDLVSKYHYPIKGKGLFGEIPDSRPETEKVLDEYKSYNDRN